MISTNSLYRAFVVRHSAIVNTLNPIHMQLLKNITKQLF